MTGGIPKCGRRGRNLGSSLHHMLEGRKYHGTGVYEHRREENRHEASRKG